MSRQVSDIVEEIVAIAFLVVMCATPLAILILGIVNVVRIRLFRATVVVQALAALAIWTLLTVVILSIFFMTVFEYPSYLSAANDLKSTAIFAGGELIYFLTAAVLIYWTWRQRKRSQISPIGTQTQFNR